MDDIAVRIRCHRVGVHLRMRRERSAGVSPYRPHNARFEAWVDAWWIPHLTCPRCFPKENT